MSTTLSYRKPVFWMILAVVFTIITIVMFFVTTYRVSNIPVDFTDYLDQDVDSVIENLKDQGMQLQNTEFVSDGIPDVSWIATEIIHGVKHQGQLEFWNREGIPCLQVIYEHYEVPYERGNVDTDYACDIIENIIDKYGKPDSYEIRTGDSFQQIHTFTSAQDLVSKEWTQIRWFLSDVLEANPYQQSTMVLQNWNNTEEQCNLYSVMYSSKHRNTYDYYEEIQR